MNTPKETMQFKAETKQLLELMIHSLYSNKEVFLRELISNASDALDKLRFAAITDTSLSPKGFEGEILLETNEKNRTLTIHDNGTGMSKDEVVSNIGTIARSGTQELLKSLEKSKEKDAPTDLIGQFGVGFYSCFMVADKVTLTTKKAGEKTATEWEYDGGGEYEIRDGARDSQGTTIVLHLKDAEPDDGLPDFTSESVIRQTVKKYSDFVRYPIILPVSRETDTDGKKETSIERETLNSMKAIWRRSDKEVTDEERGEFYKHISHDWTDPLTHMSMRAEGRLEYHSLMFVPSHAPFDLFSQAYKRGLQLYVRNVKIMDHCEDLLPEYMRFIKGVLDAQDLPLNVSREILQNNRQIASIRGTLTKKVLDSLKTLQESDNDKYLEFWAQFGSLLKEGISSDHTNREKLIPLLLFQSSNDPKKLTTLKDYISRMKDGQEEIYYLSGEARDIVEHSPHLEAFAKKELEVLFMTDPIDEFMVGALIDVEGKKLKSIGKGDVELGSDDEKKDLEEKKKDFTSLIGTIQKELDEHVSEVRLSNRLTSSPVCLVGSDSSISPHIERLMRQNKVDMPTQKRIMELNPNHKVIVGLKNKFDKTPTDASIADSANLLFGQALLAESSPLPDPAGFARLVAKLMV